MKQQQKKGNMCKICMELIDETEDHHLILTEIKKELLVSEGYYHVKCFKERFMHFDKTQKEANRILEAAQKTLLRMGIGT